MTKRKKNGGNDWIQTMVLVAFNARGDNGTHVHISKPKISFAKEYNYFKTSRYSIMAQVVVNSKKTFVDV